MPRADVDSARRPALNGTVDLAKLDGSSSFEERREGDSVHLTSAGVALTLSATRAGWVFDGPRVTVCLGGDAHAAASAIQASSSGSPLRWRERGAVVHIDLGRGVCILVTDRFAIEPLCFAHQGAKLHFCDRADGVLPVHKQVLDPQAIYNYFYFHVIPSPRTIFNGVERLEPSESLIASAKGLQRTRYWAPEFRGDAEDLAALEEEFRAAIRSAVSHERGGELGCFLSGGTDSSTVAGTLSRVRDEPVKAFSIGFDAQGYDEMEYARIAARHFALDHHEYYVTPGDLVRAMPRVAAHFDQPFGNSSAVPAYYCAQLAHSMGVTTLLAGDGGDELFGGNTRYAKQKVFDAYASIPGSLRKALIEPALLGADWTRTAPFIRKAASYVDQARTPMPDRAAAYNLLAHVGAHHIMSPRLLSQVDANEPLRLQREVYARCQARSAVDRELAYDWRFTLADNDLPKVTGATRLAGIGTSFPFLDAAIVDLSLRLPASQKVRGLKLRHFFKSAMADLLPREILRKKKHGFGLPFGQWLVKDSVLQSHCRGSLERLAANDVIRKELPAEVFATLLPQHPKFYGELVWIMTMLDGWMAEHVPDQVLRR